MSSYVESNLLPGEVIIQTGSVHGFYKFSYVLLIILAIFILQTQIALFGILLIIIGIYKISFLSTVEIVLTNKRLIYKTGVVARNIFELQLEKVESAVINQTIFQRIIGAWILVVSGTGWHNKPINLLANPTSFRSAVYQEVENNKKG